MLPISVVIVFKNSQVSKLEVKCLDIINGYILSASALQNISDFPRRIPLVYT